MDDTNDYGNKKAVLRIPNSRRIHATGWNWESVSTLITARELWRKKSVDWTLRPWTGPTLETSEVIRQGQLANILDFFHGFSG